MSAYARINHAEFESEDALAHFEDEYNAHYREWFPDMKIAIGVHWVKITTDVERLSNEEAADASLEARQKSLSLFKAPYVTNSIPLELCRCGASSIQTKPFFKQRIIMKVISVVEYNIRTGCAEDFIAAFDAPGVHRA